jgi:Activator of Hsp90 ATPase homolog 1-like protein
VQADIDITVTYRHPIDRVWAALTSSEALAAWLMPNDFQPVPGHRFTFHGLGAQITRRILASGWPGILSERLAAHLDRAAGLGPAPVPQQDPAGWRACLAAFRGWRQTRPK